MPGNEKSQNIVTVSVLRLLKGMHMLCPWHGIVLERFLFCALELAHVHDGGQHRSTYVCDVLEGSVLYVMYGVNMFCYIVWVI